MWKIKRFIYRVKRVIEFIPVIWKGYDWNYGSAIDVFQYQLTRTVDYLESDKAQALEAKTNAAKIWTAIELMEQDLFKITIIVNTLNKSCFIK